MDLRHGIACNLKIVNWNANGLKMKRSLFIVFLSQHKVDIACITETHLISSEKFTIPGYNVYRFDRDAPKASGGVAIIIRKNIPHYSIFLPYMNTLEIIGIKFQLNNTECTLYSAYHAPKYKFSHTYTENLFNPNCPTILLGDLNCKHEAWGCHKTNPNGRRLLTAALDQNLSILAPNEATHFPSNHLIRPDILDIGIFQDVPHNIFMETLVELDSDHLPVLITFDETATYSHTTSNLINGIIDWEIFQKSFDEDFNCSSLPMSNENHIDNAIQMFSDKIATAISASTIHPFKARKSYNTPPQRVLALIKLKNKCRRLWQERRLPYLRRKYNQLNRRVKWELDKLRYDSYNKHLETLSPDDNSLWFATKRILKEVTPLPSLSQNGQVYESKEEKANILADYFQSTFQPNDSDPDTTRFASEIERSLSTSISTVELPIQYTSPSQILHFIKELKLKKSPGHDKIPNIVLRNLTKKGLSFLASIFNACLNISYFPSSWKHSLIIVIHKPGKPSTQVSSYRPISLLPTLSKLFEKIVKIRLEKYIASINLIPHHQFGFRSHHSTCHQLLRVSEDIIKGFERKQHTTAVFLDVGQAFDRVWHEGLMYKLRKYGTPMYLQNIIRSFLSDRTFSVRIDSTFSSTRPIRAGVPQGAILSPLLYNIYTSDMPFSQNCNTAVYADDTLLYSTHSDINIAAAQLQDSLNSLLNWFKKWKIAINSTKSESKIFTLRRPIDPPNITVLNSEIPWNPPDQAIKYLGVYLDRKLKWKIHITKKLNLAQGRLLKLYPLINKKSPLSIKNGLLLYKSLLRPLLLYASQVWGTASTSAITKLQIFQNKVLRKILHCPWYVRNNQVHKELGVLPIKEFISKITSKFFQKLPLNSSIQHFNIGQPSILEDLRLKPKLPQDVLVNVQ